ncbi:MAG: macro domain-containing protein [Lachnospiraceae bacterium]|nr:macro domain-containing protein [Candidatus Equihabitans merdae]
MPFQIVRNDITKMHTDAIVNTANPKVRVGDGVDRAIYEAAGYDELLAARAGYGDLDFGQACLTPAFALPSKFIIHVSGPIWQGGKNHEADILKQCYDRCLQIALENACESIAFPLLATGTYRFPKEMAMQIALASFSEFLLQHEMMIYLVVFDADSYQISDKLFADVSSYIDQHYVDVAHQMEHPSQYRKETARWSAGPADDDREDVCASPVRPRESASEPRYAEPLAYASRRPNMASSSNMGRERGSFLDRLGWRKDRKKTQKESVEITEEDVFSAPFEAAEVEEESIFAPQPGFAEDGIFGAPSGDSLEDILAGDLPTLSEYLQQLINKRGLTNVETYTRANMDKKYFSKLINGKVHPTKLKLLTLCIALELNLDETIDFLAMAGYALTPLSKTDLIFRFFIERQRYDIYEVDIALFDNGQPTIVPE